jgi:hypothetical protein
VEGKVDVAELVGARGAEPEYRGVECGELCSDLGNWALLSLLEGGGDTGGGGGESRYTLLLRGVGRSSPSV